MERLFENPRAEIIARTKKTVDNIVSLILSDRKATSQLPRLARMKRSDSVRIAAANVLEEFPSANNGLSRVTAALSAALLMLMSVT